MPIWDFLIPFFINGFSHLSWFWLMLRFMVLLDGLWVGSQSTSSGLLHAWNSYTACAYVVFTVCDSTWPSLNSMGLRQRVSVPKVCRPGQLGRDIYATLLEYGTVHRRISGQSSHLLPSLRLISL